MDQTSVLLMKLVMIGDSGVGKTCLLSRYVDDIFYEEANATIGVEYKLKEIEIESSKFKLQLWDTAGQERFHSITQSYYRCSDGAVIVFDVTDNASFENVSNWIKEYSDFTDGNHNIIIVGNKNDLESERKVNTEDAKQFAKSKNVEYIETSAKDGNSVTEAFELIEQIIYTSKKASLSLNQRVVRPIDLENSKKGCC